MCRLIFPVIAVRIILRTRIRRRRRKRSVCFAKLKSWLENGRKNTGMRNALIAINK
jgi:hypothetical protein